MLPVIEFALNNAVHDSTGFAPFYVNSLHTPCSAHVTTSWVLGLVGESLLTSLMKSALPRRRNKSGSFLRRALVSYDMCVKQWLEAKTNKKNKLMLKAEDVLIFMKLETKSYLNAKTYLRM